MSKKSSTISGILEQLPFAELVQTLANLGRTGKLSLSRFGENGAVFFREGRIIGAASTSVRETLGSLLIGQRLVAEDTLTAALELQRQENNSRRLGMILLEQGALSAEDLQGVIRQQTQRVVSELMRWRRGYFEFEALKIEDRDEFESELVEVMIPEGLSAESVLLASAVAIDEASDRDAAIEPEETDEAHRIASLRDLLLEIRSPEFTGELTTSVMEYAAELASRCALFSIQGGYFCGMAYYGDESNVDATHAVRELRIPVGEPSILADVAARHEAYKGPLRDAPWNHALLEAMGGGLPEQAIAAPLVVNNRVMMLIYGDALPGGGPLGSQSELELMTLQVGLAMEKKLLEERRGETAEPASEAVGLHADDFKSLLDSDPEPIVIVSPDSVVLYANEVFCSIFGQPVDRMVGEAIKDGVHPEDVSDLLEIVLEVSRGGAPGGNTVRFREPDGSWRKCYLLPSALGTHGGDRYVMLRALTAGEIHTRFDPLTGLLDFQALIERVDRSLSRARQQDVKPFALLFVGIDRFTLINVQYGWARGNEALRTVADRLADNLRPGDIVSRAGGDRFCVLLDQLRGTDDGALVADRIAEFLSQPLGVGQDELSLSVSVGVVTSDDGYKTAHDMIEDAKTAMLEAKARAGTSVAAI